MSTINAAGLLASINQVKADMERFTPIAPIRVVESNLCVRKTGRPNKVHKVHRWMSDQYHRRIQKKWVKRYGLEEIPTAYVLPAQKRWPSEVAELVVVIHPSLAAQLDEQMSKEWA